MPFPVRVAQVLLYVVAGLTLVLSVAALIALGVSGTSLGQVASFALPGFAGFVLALLIPKRGAWLWRAIIALQIVYVVLSLARLGGGDFRGFVNLIIPLAILISMTRPSARIFFRDRAHRPY